MKKIAPLALILLLLLCPCPAFAAGKLSVSQENFHFVEGFWSYGYSYAKVENTGDKPIQVNAGILEIYDAEGNVITSSDYLYAYAEYLQPGEYTYVEIRDEIEEEGVVPDDYMLTLTGKSDDSVISLRLPCESSLKLGVSDGWWEYNYMYATVTNDTDEPLYGISLLMALLDAEGNILYMAEDSLYSDRALMPGSSMIFRHDISSSFIDYFKANGIRPACVDAIAYVDMELE